MSNRNPSVSTSASSLQFDFTVENFGTIIILRCNTERAKTFLLKFVEPDAQWFGDALAVNARFIGGLVSSLREDGWRVG